MGKSIRGPCPIHQGKNFTSFSIDPDNGLWHCFSCGEGGSFKELVDLLDPTGLEAAQLSVRMPPISKPDKLKHAKQLQFKLTLDPNHNYLKKRNILLNTTREFGLGYCNYGIMKGKIAIPIHDEKNRLVAYTGRSIDDSFPKYKLPKDFVKSSIIYNYLKAVNSNKAPVFLVEGYFDVFSLYQYGFSAVSVMGTSVSLYQLNLIKQLKKHIIIFFDGDNAGIKGTIKAVKLFKNHNISCSVLNIFGKDPDNTELATISSALQQLHNYIVI